jgi:hypothetical protein
MHFHIVSPVSGESRHDACVPPLSAWLVPHLHLPLTTLQRQCQIATSPREPSTDTRTPPSILDSAASSTPNRLSEPWHTSPCPARPSHSLHTHAIHLSPRRPPVSSRCPRHGGRAVRGDHAPGPAGRLQQRAGPRCRPPPPSPVWPGKHRGLPAMKAVRPWARIPTQRRDLFFFFLLI